MTTPLATTTPRPELADPADARARPSPFPFDNSYARLPERLFARTDPTPVASPRLLKLNRPLASLLGLDADALDTEVGASWLGGSSVPAGAAPLALAYAGHQFGQFVPSLGDGRAVLLGEVVGTDGRRRDIQLKGSGPTPFSRRGDGRAALGPVLREYVVSEAMHALGIPTTRSLAAVLTGEHVFRETALPGAVLTRVAASHIRIGTFQYFAARRDVDAIRALADHAIARHDPAAAASATPYRAFLDGVIARQAVLVAEWMRVGFVHGVMNTDNTAISGEAIDYGPCAFLDGYDADTVFSSIDQAGRYAFGNQPAVLQWNLARLAEAMLPLLGDTDDAAIGVATEALGGFAPRVAAAHLAGYRRKLGLLVPADEDASLIDDLLRRMAANGVDFTLFFRALCTAADVPDDETPLRAVFPDGATLDAWLDQWRARTGREPSVAPGARAAAMRLANPAYIPRNHQVEAAIAAALGGDLGPFDRLLAVTSRPYEEQPDRDDYALPPRPEQRVLQTFCGT